MIIVKKLYCPHCMNEQKIECELDYDRHSGISIGVPYCTKCKEQIKELKNEFISEYQVNDYSEIKNTKEESYNPEKIFSDKPYLYQQFSYNVLFIVIGLSYLFFLIIISIFLKSIIVFTFITICALLSSLVLAYISVRSRFYFKIYNYLLNNGKKYSGKVVNLYKFNKSSSNSNIDSTYKNYYFFEVEYFNSQKNETINFFTPEINEISTNIKNIKCDVYAIDDFPGELKNQALYKKFKVIPHEYAINFKSF